MFRLGLVVVMAALLAMACQPAAGPAAPAAPAATGPTFRPSGAVEFVVHTAPGGGMDVAAREWIDIMQKENLIDQPWRVDNQSGGAGGRAMAYLANQQGKADVVAGMTVTWVVTPLTTTEVPHSYRNFTPIARMVLEKTVVAVPADSPYRRMQDFIDAARAQPGRLNQSGGSVTAVDNLSREIIQKATGARWNYLPFPSGGERIAALLGGTAQVMFGSPGDFSEQARAGRVRVIAILADERVSLYPEVPTLAEQGIRADIPAQMRGVLGPPDMPREAVAYYEDLFRRLTQTPGWKELVQKEELQSAYLPGAEFGRFLEAESVKLEVLIKELGLTQ